MLTRTRIHPSLFITGPVAVSLLIAPMSSAQARRAEPADATPATESAAATDPAGAATEPAGAATEPATVTAPEGPALAPDAGAAPAPTADTSKPPRTGRGLLITGIVFTGLGMINSAICTAMSINDAAPTSVITTCSVSVVQLGVGLGLLLGGRRRAKKYAEWKAAHPHAVAVAPLIPNGRTGAPAGLNLSLRF